MLMRRSATERTARLASVPALHPALGVALVVAAVSCSRSSRSTVADTVLVTISPESAAASPRTTIAELTIASGAADRGPMRDMIKVAAGPDDRIAVLDRAMHKVKIYDSAGALTRVIDLNSCASELKVPRPFALAFASDGGIWVVDIADGRATLLSSGGTCVRTVSIPRGPGLPLGFAVSPSGDLHDAVAPIVNVSGSGAIATDITIRSLRVDRPLVASVLALDNRPQPFA